MYWDENILKMYTKIFTLDSKVKNQVVEQNVDWNIIFPKGRHMKIRDILTHLYFYMYRLTCSYKVKGLES